MGVTSGSLPPEEQPLVSVVTPSFQSRPFIEQTIESVLSQDYPRVEYIVMDGGSTDGTLEILERYSGRLQYVSARDGGAADAINRGFRQCHGSIFAWLNADDLYLPGAIATAARRLAASPDVDVVYGEAIWIDAEGKRIGRYPTMSPYRPAIFEQECGICQPAAFMRREAFENAGMLRDDLRYAFDYDLWARLSESRRFQAIPSVLAASRMHRENKTLGNRRGVFQENIALLRRQYGYVPLKWIYGYVAYLRDGRDQFFDPIRYSPMTYLATLPVGIAYNLRRPWRYLREWTRQLTRENLRRLWQNGRQ